MRQAVRAIIIKDQQILVLERHKFGQHYFALVGGGIDAGETAEQALARELKEESSIVMTNPRLVVVEHAGPMYGTQYIYLCDYVSGEPALAADSEEAQIHALGQNLYQPRWLPLAELPSTPLLPDELKQLLLTFLRDGFPDAPVTLTVAA